MEEKKPALQIIVQLLSGIESADGKWIPEEEIFDTAIGYQLNGDLLAVTDVDGSNTVIPMREIEKIKIIPLSFQE